MLFFPQNSQTGWNSVLGVEEFSRLVVFTVFVFQNVFPALVIVRITFEHETSMLDVVLPF